VYFLFNDEVQIEVEEDLGGGFVKAHGHFEFVLRRAPFLKCFRAIHDTCVNTSSNVFMEMLRLDCTSTWIGLIFVFMSILNTVVKCGVVIEN